MKEAINQLKNNKATGPDLLRNEMFKSGQHVLIKPICKLFNLVYRSGHYPESWSEGRIISIHKKGDRYNPANYRGITISSSLGKMFNSILNRRLYSFLDSRNIICPEQIGFRKKHRTADHLFILKNLIAKYKKNRKPLYIAFIDFQKAFDTVWHQGLLYKLLQIGVSSKFYNIIQSMYSNINLSVQLNKTLSPMFKSRIGVWQGDNLSPTLFNIYVNEIPLLFDDSCLPARFGDMKIAALLYADDLVLFSESNEGLQRAIDKLSVFCENWALNINTEKSKLMCVNTSLTKTPPSIHLRGVPLQVVNSYKYLGLEISDDGKALLTMQDLYHRALKVYFKLARSIQPLPKPKILFHLFDHIIKPVLLYACEIWTPLNLEYRLANNPQTAAAQFINNIKQNFPLEHKFCETSNPIEKLHLKFCRFVLGVHSKTTNLAIYGETGRYPLYIDQIVQCVKYYNHLQNSENRLLRDFFIT